MNELQRFLIIGQLTIGPVYLVAVFAAGFLIHAPAAWKMAILSMGLTFLSYALQSLGRKWSQMPGEICAVASILIAAAGGLALLVH